MKPSVTECAPETVLPFRTRHRAEVNAQIVHDSLHRREGWTRIYLLSLDGRAVGFGGVAVGGPWKDKPTIFEFYILPEQRHRAFALFEEFLVISDARHFEVQTNEALLTVMLHTYGQTFTSEKIVLADGLTTHLPSNGATLLPLTPRDDLLAAIRQRQGGGEWILEVEGTKAASGGILFHYNRPYGDIYMETVAGFRRRGFGSYLVQELKRACYELGAIPCARCNPDNIASRNTLQQAGLVPVAHIINAVLAPGPQRRSTRSRCTVIPDRLAALETP
jgi:GNAT superfamily N-acetyltransferase